MGKSNKMKELFTSVLDKLGKATWIEIATESPRCTYYFGPFYDESEAEEVKAGYVEDLESEGSRCIAVTIKQCKPQELTVFDDSKEVFMRPIPSLSGQSR